MVSGRVVLAADRLAALDDRLNELQQRLKRIAAGEGSSPTDVRDARIHADRQRARAAAAEALLSRYRRKPVTGTASPTSSSTCPADGPGMDRGPAAGTAPGGRPTTAHRAGVDRIRPTADQYWRVVVDHARRTGWRNWTEALCRVGAATLPSVRGVAVSAFTEQLPCPMAASDSRTQRIEELQQVLGEGPAMSACRDGRPVDVRLTQRVDAGWLGWVQAVQRSGVMAVWSFPYRWPGIGCAAVTFYRGTDGDAADEYAEGSLLSRLAGKALRLDLDRNNSSGLDVLETVHVAAGMLAERIGVTAVDAFARIRACAFADDRDLMEVATGIITGGLRLD
ncbi:ANTAR domain-containing protein [Microlunatus sp. Gsoil 973]|uniref:ANTAR domain-containing protein n=1 Tax=Microlunatus sp. Gsoil 973 TaxID=2672569 RepID=UPI0012B45F21|nr:ANTAR domain-containing protein [Microlunatus sp. Gsoil 973]QGN33042.1 hypothetical protein GJV80_09710 [Microlunatus sp. Gsoil 973]